MDGSLSESDSKDNGEEGDLVKKESRDGLSNMARQMSE